MQFRGADWEVAALEALNAQIGPLPAEMADASAPISSPTFAALCAAVTGESEETFQADWVIPALTRQGAAVLSVRALHGPRRKLLTYTDKEEIDGWAVGTVETLCAYGVLSSGNATFDPDAPMTNACAAALLVRLGQADRAAPTAQVTFQGFTAGGEKLTEAQQKAIVDFCDLYYRGLAELRAVDLSPVTDPLNPKGRQLEEAVLTLQRGRRIYSGIDLTISQLDYRFSCTNVTKLSSGRIDVTLNDSSSMYFRGAGGVLSEIPNTERVFTLSPQADGSWRVWSMRSDESAHVRLAKVKDPAKEAQTALAQGLACLAEREAQRALPPVAKTAANPYDREAARQYAFTYFKDRNPDYKDYSSGGGNCQNFVSQCLLTGGIPTTDTTGHIWRPRSTAWVNVNHFETYVRQDAAQGMVAQWGAPFFTGEVGDVVHTSWWSHHRAQHAMIITDVIRDEQGNVLDYLLCSNTCNWRSVPLSAHGYDYVTLIKIYGWN